jgi:hypothetical protein
LEELRTDINTVQIVSGEGKELMTETNTVQIAAGEGEERPKEIMKILESGRN